MIDIPWAAVSPRKLCEVCMILLWDGIVLSSVKATSEDS